MSDQTCSDCGRPSPQLSRGRCNTCYKRWWKTQTRAGVLVLRPSVEERFTARRSPQANGCIHWTGFVGKRGYGALSVSGTPTPAHRVAYELFIGPIPEGMVLDHVCHNRDLSCRGGASCLHRRCVNVDHLEPVDFLENFRRSPLTPTGKPPRPFCGKGHALDDENTYVNREGHRKCKECHREDRRKARAATPRKPRPQQCRRGHQLTEENTYRYKNRRVCRQCARDRDRAAYHRKRGNGDAASTT